MLHLNDVTLRVAGRPLLEAARLHIPQGQRVGLVGRNGTGKSTLLKLILGEMSADQGDLRLRSGARIATVAQDAPGGSITPMQAVLAADKERLALLEEAESATDPARIADIQNRLAEIGAASAEARAARILRGLGFDDEAQKRPLSSFSGGWRMRVALAGVLFLEPDLLLLDEPTNHLDLEAAIWLENYLRRYPHTLILVSHDRDFLNSVPQRIVHLHDRKLNAYSGNYDQFAAKRSEQAELNRKMREKQLAQRKHMQSFVDRFRYKASKAKQAQSRIKMLEKMDPVAELAMVEEVRFDFKGGKVSAPPLLTMHGAEVGYGGPPVLRGLSLRIDPEDRIALLGANGNGKSTFAKLVAGSLTASTGEVTRANGLEVGFFEQHQIEALEADETGLDHLRHYLPQEREERLRARLAQFGLIQDKAVTPAKHLSGGEKTRLSFALMCLKDPQILILDEPTNHLDIESRRALVDAVNAFPGAVLLISHDRHMVELTTEQLWLVKGGRVQVYDQDVAAYRDSLLAESQMGSAAARPAVVKPAERISASERRARLAPLRARAKEAENELAKWQSLQSRVQAKLSDPSSYEPGSPVDTGKLQADLKLLEERIAHAEERWLAAEDEIEKLELTEI